MFILDERWPEFLLSEKKRERPLAAEAWEEGTHFDLIPRMKSFWGLPGQNRARLALMSELRGSDSREGGATVRVSDSSAEFRPSHWSPDLAAELWSN